MDSVLRMGVQGAMLLAREGDVPQPVSFFPTEKVFLKHKERIMVQGQFESSGQQSILTMERNRLLRQHPVLIPVTLVLGSIGLCIVSFFADTLFPLLALIGAPSPLICLSI